ncbi:MAG: hypothetical protein J7K89_02390 [Candidatus Cloacimonetes bacterium]|nr:hypothetical protein [Candidatus Cloacimonadota bacterium]
MTKWIVTALLLVTFLAGWADVVSEQQDADNQAFLSAVDKNLINTIRMLSAFEAGADRMDALKGVPEYRQFLMNNTIECSQMRNIIQQAQKDTPVMRVSRVREIIETLNPGITFSYDAVTAEQDEENRIFLAKFGSVLVTEIKRLTELIVQREQTFEASQSIDKEYFNLHSHHYLFSMLLNVISPSKHLSATNRGVLAQIVHGVEAQLQKEAAAQRTAHE